MADRKKTDEEPKRVIKPQTIYSYVNSCDKLNLVSVVIVLISIATITVIGIDECKRCFAQKPTCTNQQLPGKTYWIYGSNIESGYLKHVFNVLHRLGYKNDPNATDWDLLWAHEYPFRRLKNELSKLKPHQRVNHFPGCGYVTNKVNLATSGLPYIPRAFKLPKDKERLVEFSEKFPEKEFVEKNNYHRNVRVRKLQHIDLNSNESFVQEFIGNPLLVSGHMFDIGIYTVITSVDPLRVYIYNGDYLLRFCPEKYHPFDPNNLNKYVVGDDYLPTWQVPGLEYYYNHLGTGMRDSLSAYLQKQGRNPSVIWEQIEDSIRTVFLAKEPSILNVVKMFGFKDNFFEMMRFDFVVDDDLKVHLMEANMSPNLSSAHFKPNQLLYEQVLYNVLSIVGVAERIQKDSLAQRDSAEELMQSADKNIAVMMLECENQCRHTCEPVECALCKPCMSQDVKNTLLKAHREHLHRGDCKRVFPPAMSDEGEFPADFKNYSVNNQLIYRWFKEKCRMDSSWCN